MNKEILQRYRTHNNEIVSIILTIDGNGLKWTSYCRGENWSIRRLKSRFLPLRNSPEAAQKDLDAYATRKGWGHA
jgi:hypothetical protein